MSRIAKQIIYGIIFIAILAGLIILCMSSPTEDDSIITPIESQKQNLQILSFNEVASSTGLRSDYVIKIYNPNNSYGASIIKYSLNMQKDRTYILPLEKKNIIIINEKKRLEEKDFSINEIIWVEINKEKSADLLVHNKQYNADDGSLVTATVFNKSDYDFLKVDVDIILYDSNEDPIAVSYSQLDNVLSLEKRSFESVWPQRISGDVANVYIQASSNIMDEENIKSSSN